MSWNDKESISQILKLKNEYDICTFVETGTFKGVNVRLHSCHWKEVLSCDISEEYLSIARKYNSDKKNVVIEKKRSVDFIRDFIKKYNSDKREDIVFFFLDAHFYDKLLSPENKWVIVSELRALEGFENCVLCLHDFDCSGLGHLCYDGEHLGFPLIIDKLKKINPDFNMYVNSKDTCDIYDEETIYQRKEIIVNEDVLENVRLANSCDRLKYRGLLYCTPTPIDLSKYNLRRA